ncbi:antitoxin Xre/MbcA/ParS toxin-binding domain-containing protein [Chitinimonas sp. BJB300]|uniref:antitoxin Xre/MbcA/ParS toxin-binding domain-containing protein n=1 Tax=Chitinimonas sp. BJB300 TaxID=1559339 RepID=UPI000C0E20D2|nr:antitoxin Xre/MbcA/ParS toxin-binding domain-containing protein [Chitinimonas sp. BJB300]PHV10069.1 hypothetical protein CSQ89_18155 [Chitinimonas sp. BJB300]TSJ83274.1 XRE family transcriptional regulator [Chitinimonas sp. BJB300]
MSALEAVKYDPAAVLTEAVVNAAHDLELNQAELADILGISASSASRLCNGGYELSISKPGWDAATTFLLVYRSLGAILGNNLENMRAWLKSYNSDLADTPANLISRQSGLHQVRGYLDAYRGRC